LKTQRHSCQRRLNLDPEATGSFAFGGDTTKRMLFWLCWWYVVRTVKRESMRLAALAQTLDKMTPTAALLFQLPGPGRSEALH